MQFQTEYKTPGPNGSIEVITETLEVDEDEVAELLSMAMDGNLHEVNGETIRSELERRGSVEEGTL
jgi:hypothetical protein